MQSRASNWLGRSIILSRSPVVEIISLAHVEGQLVFVQLASLAGLSHIRLLHGDLIGCAMSNDVSIPHLVNWRTKATYALAEFPDENVSLSLVD